VGLDDPLTWTLIGDETSQGSHGQSEATDMGWLSDNYIWQSESGIAVLSSQKEAGFFLKFSARCQDLKFPVCCASVKFVYVLDPSGDGRTGVQFCIKSRNRIELAEHHRG